MQKSFSEKFLNYCNSENFEINENQIKVAKKIQDYYKKNFKSFFSSLFYNLKRSIRIEKNPRIAKSIDLGGNR